MATRILACLTMLFCLLATPMASTASAAEWGILSWFYGDRCPRDSMIGKDAEANFKILIEAAGNSADAGYVQKIAEKILIAPNQTIQNLRQTYQVACEAYFTSKTITKSQFVAFSEAWMRQMSELTGDSGPTVVLLDSVANSYRPELREIGASNADDIIAGFRTLAEFKKGFPVIHAENTSMVWNRTDFVLRQKPKVVVAHFSAFEAKTSPLLECVARADATTLCNDKFFDMMRRLLSSDVSPYVIVYTRTKGICREKSDFRRAFRQLLSMDTNESILRKVLLLDMSKRNFEHRTAILELEILIQGAIDNQPDQAVNVGLPGTANGLQTRCLLSQP